MNITTFNKNPNSVTAWIFLGKKLEISLKVDSILFRIDDINSPHRVHASSLSSIFSEPASRSSQHPSVYPQWSSWYNNYQRIFGYLVGLAKAFVLMHLSHVCCQVGVCIPQGSRLRYKASEYCNHRSIFS